MDLLRVQVGQEGTVAAPTVPVLPDAAQSAAGAGLPAGPCRM